MAKACSVTTLLQIAPDEAAVRSLIPALIAFPLAASPVAAQQFSAVCSNLSGMRVEDQGSKPRFEPDAVSGASWAYGWDLKTEKATVTFPTKASGGQPNTQKGTVSFHRGGFFTIVSLLPGAVWTHAIYGDSGRLLVTQSTTKRRPRRPDARRNLRHVPLNRAAIDLGS